MSKRTKERKSDSKFFINLNLFFQSLQSVKTGLSLLKSIWDLLEWFFRHWGGV